MNCYGVTIPQLKEIADDYGFILKADQRSTHVQFSLRLPHENDRKPFQDNLYRHKSISWNNERWTPSVCYHGHFDFMYDVFTKYPNARITSSYYMKCNYKGMASFQEQAVKLAHVSIGAPIMGGFPTMIESCDCHTHDYGIRHDIDNGSD